MRFRTCEMSEIPSLGIEAIFSVNVGVTRNLILKSSQVLSLRLQAHLYLPCESTLYIVQQPQVDIYSAYMHDNSHHPKTELPLVRIDRVLDSRCSLEWR